MVDMYNRWVPDYPGQTPQADRAYMTAVQRGIFPTINTPPPAYAPAPMAGAPAPQPQPVSPPTIHADLIQITDISEVDKYTAHVGAPLGFITQSEDKIIFKTAGPDGPVPLTVYIKQPSQPEKQAFNPVDYVRKDEIKGLVNEAILAYSRAPKSEVKDSESI